MQLKNRLHYIFLFTLVAIIIAANWAHAKTYLVLVDNSQTIRQPPETPLSTSYEKDISAIL